MASTQTKGLILDTHIWIWLINGSSELPASTVDRIEAASMIGEVFIPVIVIWEVATLVAKQRITLKLPTAQWVDEALSKQGVELVPLLPQIAVESAQLPADFHGDPADRLIVATARIKRVPLLTRDSKILEYSRMGHVEAMKA